MEAAAPPRDAGDAATEASVTPCNASNCGGACCGNTCVPRTCAGCEHRLAVLPEWGDVLELERHLRFRLFGLQAGRCERLCILLHLQRWGRGRRDLRAECQQLPGRPAGRRLFVPSGRRRRRRDLPGVDTSVRSGRRPPPLPNLRPAWHRRSAMRQRRNLRSSYSDLRAVVLACRSAAVGPCVGDDKRRTDSVHNSRIAEDDRTHTEPGIAHTGLAVGIAAARRSKGTARYASVAPAVGSPAIERRNAVSKVRAVCRMGCVLTGLARTT